MLVAPAISAKAATFDIRIVDFLALTQTILTEASSGDLGSVFDGATQPSHAAILSSFSARRATIFSTSSGSGRCSAHASSTLLAYISGGYTQAEFGGVDYTNNLATAAFATVNGAVAFALASTGSPGIQLGSQRYDGFFIGGGTEYSIGLLPGLF
jgi:hypothetical protein